MKLIVYLCFPQVQVIFAPNNDNPISYIPTNYKNIFMSTQNWKFKTTNNGNHFWEVLDINSNILGRSSQDFKSKSGSQYNADLLGRSGNFSQKLIWDIFENSTGDWSWKCNNIVNKENVGASHKVFETKKEAVQNAVKFGYNGEFTTLLNAQTITDKDSTVTVNATDTNKTKVSFAAPSVGISTSSSENKNKTYSSSSSLSADENENSLGWLKWLIPLLLLAGLIFWLIPMFTKPSLDIPKDDTKLQLSSTLNPKVTGIFDTIKAPNFSALSLALKTSNISDLINKAGPLTLLAPSNEAFNKLSVQTLSDLQKSENLGQLQTLLKGHFFKGNLELSSLKDGQTITNLNEQKLAVKVEGDKLFIGDVEVEKTLDASSSDVKAYSIPTLLTLEKSGESTQPTNPSESTPQVETALVSKYIQGSMLEKLNASGNFGTLLAAIEAADLTATLEGTGPFTIFAPNDNALKASGATVTELLKPENKANLQTFLKNHVVSGKNTFADFQARKFLTTLGGESIVIETNPSNVGQVVTSKNTVTAPTPDIDTNNAVIHELTTSTLF